MRIVLVDDIGIGADDLRRLEERGDVLVCSGAPANDAEIIERLHGAEVAISGWTKIGRDVLHASPELRLVSLWATGLDNVDLAAASARGVAVCNVPAYATGAVAELALGLMLAVIRKIPAAARNLRRTNRSDWQPFQGAELGGKTLGVVGTGAIGRHVARLCHCLGMTLLGHDLQASETLVRDLGMRYAPLADVFAQSDVVTLHAPLTRDTEHLVDASLLRLLPETAVIINTARAQLVRQDDLYEALREKRIAGAGLDVVDLDLPSGPGLLELDNVVVTPHIGFYTREALAKLTAGCVENVIRFLDDDPINVAATEPDAGAGRAAASTPGMRAAEDTEPMSDEVDNDVF